MMTPQDIRDKTFEKAIFGGYDMGSVDDFLDKVAGDLAGAQKEIMILKAKMKVLVDKVEEYRSNEDALNRALLSAQKLSVQIEAEARHKADVVVAEANTKANSMCSAASPPESAARKRPSLSDARRPPAASSPLCVSCAIAGKAAGRHLRRLFRHEHPRSQDRAAGRGFLRRVRSIDDTVRSIEDSVARIQAEPAASIDLDGIRYEAPTGDDAPAPQPDTTMTTILSCSCSTSAAE
jgi:DivIVA domain-containing protein